MNLRKRMEHEINLAQKRLEETPESTPLNIKKLWEQELVDLEIELNNLVDDEEDNNDL